VKSLDGQHYKLIVMGPGDSFTPDRAVGVIREVFAQFQP
jgi:hypothetical protein